MQGFDLLIFVFPSQTLGGLDGFGGFVSVLVEVHRSGNKLDKT
jgi:hypothetical protein